MDDNNVIIGQRAFLELFAEFSYNSLSSVNYIIEKSGTTWKEYLGAFKKSKNQPGRVIGGFTPDMVSAQDPKYQELMTQSGRCTWLAVKASEALTYGKIKEEENELFDLTGHRLLRNRANGIVIDSSSTEGAFVLPPKTWKTIKQGLRYYYDPEAKTLTVEKPSFKTGGVVTQIGRHVPLKIQGMGICLNEVKKKLPMVLLFRSIEEKPKSGSALTEPTTLYHGIMIWSFDKGKAKLTLQPNLSDPERRAKVINFNSPTEETRVKMVMLVYNFVAQNSDAGHNKREDGDSAQWVRDAPLFFKIWANVESQYGYASYGGSTIVQDYDDGVLHHANRGRTDKRRGSDATGRDALDPDRRRSRSGSNSGAPGTPPPPPGSPGSLGLRRSQTFVGTPSPTGSPSRSSAQSPPVASRSPLAGARKTPSPPSREEHRRRPGQ